jgi:hypothetical protein
VFRRDATGAFVEDWDGGGEPDGLAIAPVGGSAISAED